MRGRHTAVGETVWVEGHATRRGFECLVIATGLCSPVSQVWDMVRFLTTKRAAGLTPSDLPSLAKNVLQALWRCTTLPKWVAEFNPPVGLGVCLLGAKWDTAGVRWVTTVVLFPQHHRLRHKH